MLGRTFGRLTVLAMEGEVRHKASRWLCQCRCGKKKVVNGKNLRNSHTRSCGCLQDEVRRCNSSRKERRENPA
ncbi:MAG: hypothetical protein LM514_04765, partial [Streptococcus sp.]|nr:hypothetical protein [Streptococcus sp.]